MKRTLIFYPHDNLREIARPVQRFDLTLSDLLADMKEIMLEKKGVGIAAPQVNVLRCCFLVHWKDEIHTFINPHITYFSEEIDRYEEGCLSIPGVFADVDRSMYIELSVQDECGAWFDMDAEGFFARIIQHECDHLKGVLFFDHLARGTQRRLLKTYHRLQEAKERDK